MFFCKTHVFSKQNCFDYRLYAVMLLHIVNNDDIDNATSFMSIAAVSIRNSNSVSVHKLCCNICWGDARRKSNFLIFAHYYSSSILGEKLSTSTLLVAKHFQQNFAVGCALDYH